MEQIKRFLKEWNISRTIRLVLAGILFTAYYFNRENIFLFIGIVLTAQSVLNITCPGGSCKTEYKSNEKTELKFKKFEQKK